MDGHLHTYAEAAEVAGMVHICGECAHVAVDPLVCMACARIICSAHLPPYVYQRNGSCDDGRAHETRPEKPDNCSRCGAWFTAEARPPVSA